MFLLSLSPVFAEPAPTLTVTASFEGGSAEVVEVDRAQARIRIRPAGDPQRGWPCWWYLRVDGVHPGETLTLEVDASQMKQADGRPLARSWALPERAAYSIDGSEWRQTAVGNPFPGGMAWSQQVTAERVSFAWGPPFTPADAERLVDSLAESPHAVRFQLARSRTGRRIPGLAVTDANAGGENKLAVWVQARQHAWESGGSWVGRGFAEWLVSDDDRAEELRRRAVVYYIPIMDVDNVASGNGGKNQVPQDHNRDWFEGSHWPSVRAAMQRIQALDASGRFALFVDLHNPGPSDRRPYFYVSPDELLTSRGIENLERFLEAARTEIDGPLTLESQPRTSGRGYDPRWERISKNWISSHTSGHVVAVTLETAWNTPQSTVGGYTTVGRQLGLSIERYLRTDPRIAD